MVRTYEKVGAEGLSMDFSYESTAISYEMSIQEDTLTTRTYEIVANP